MLLRSKSALSDTLLTQPHAPSHNGIKALTKRKPKFIDTSDASKNASVGDLCQAYYGYPGRSQQLDVVVDLLNGNTAFLLAGTGFGKSRVPELYYLAHDPDFHPIILCINPLEGLGNDQVIEKALVGLNAVNLTAPNCTTETCDDILKGKYNFVYVSPEIALTSPVFDRMWRDRRFQDRLILSVVDEAHMVYKWGLVESGEAKRLASHVRVSDGGVFRPSYGDLARRFLSTGKVPLLLMSATCTPQAQQKIMVNLKLDINDVKFSRAELTRPEIRLIRRTFKRPMKGSLRGIFGHHMVVPTAAIPPTLIYSGTQNATLDDLKIINSSRGHPKEAGNGHSDFARRYHATTGPKSKLDTVATFVKGTLAIICCTLALGLGQNWHRVRRVIINNRQDPCNFIQMSGRCGRDGRRGLGIILVEYTRTKGKNKISDFITPTVQTDDDRMDALAITPVCLRVALAVDLSLGYIPLDPASWAVQEEEERQADAEMESCDCSNCKPEEAEALWLAQAALTNDNFDQALRMSEAELLQLVADLPEPPPPPPAEIQPFCIPCGKDDPIEVCVVLEKLVTMLERSFHVYFYNIFTQEPDLGPDDYFGRALAWDVAKNIDILHQPSDFEIVLASETLAGQFNCLFLAFCLWKNSYDTTDVFAQAVKRRKLAIRAKSNNHKPQQSCEGFLLASARAEATRTAEKLARAQEDAELAVAKAIEQEELAAAKAAEKTAREAAKAAEKGAQQTARENAKAAKKEALAIANAAKKEAKAAAKAIEEQHLASSPQKKAYKRRKQASNVEPQHFAVDTSSSSSGPAHPSARTQAVPSGLTPFQTVQPCATSSKRAAEDDLDSGHPH